MIPNFLTSTDNLPQTGPCIINGQLGKVALVNFMNFSSASSTSRSSTGEVTMHIQYPSGSSSGSSSGSPSQARLSPSLPNKTQQKAHVFTLEQEEYIARLISVPETWELLDAPNEIKFSYRPKTEVWEEIAMKVCHKLSTEEKELTLDGAQIKNKIGSMRKVWKNANRIFKTGYGDLPFRTLEARVLQASHFYYILVDVLSASWCLHPREPIQLTGNLTHGVLDMGDDLSEESDGQDTVVAVSNTNEARQDWQDISTNVDKRMSPSPMTQLKKRKNDFSANTDVLQDVVRSTWEDKFKRRRLEFDERKDLREDHLIQLQTQKLEMEMEMEIERKAKELQLQKIANEAKRAKMEEILLKVEMVRQTQCHRLSCRWRHKLMNTKSISSYV